MIPIHLRNLPGNIETYDHVSIIEHLASWIKPRNYLEIGVRDGTCLTRIQKYAKTCYAVDISFEVKNYNKNVNLYEISSDDFFKILDKNIKFDMVFIDGDHKKEQVYQDFLNVQDKVVDDGFVILHDTYPFNLFMTDSTLSYDCWEAMQKIKLNFFKKWEILTLPFNPGLTIMKKMDLEKQVLWM